MNSFGKDKTGSAFREMAYLIKDLLELAVTSDTLLQNIQTIGKPQTF